MIIFKFITNYQLRNVKLKCLRAFKILSLISSYKKTKKNFKIVVQGATGTLLNNLHCKHFFGKNKFFRA